MIWHRCRNLATVHPGLSVMAATEGDGRVSPPPAAPLPTPAEEGLTGSPVKAAEAAPGGGSAGRRRNFPGTWDQSTPASSDSAHNMASSFTPGANFSYLNLFSLI